MSTRARYEAGYVQRDRVGCHLKAWSRFHPRAGTDGWAVNMLRPACCVQAKQILRKLNSRSPAKLYIESGPCIF